jgi:xanthine dehydrogenase accessory factor
LEGVFAVESNVVLNLLPQIIDRVRQGEAVALCTVVQARGSTPQGAGAAMLVLADGKTLGTLGGGCVEAEVRVQAQRLMAESRNQLLTFRLDHDYGWDDGLVCGGTMDIAVEVIGSPSKLAPLETLLETVAAGREGSWVIEVTDGQSKPARFEMPLAPTPCLLIAGAGHVGQALAELAGQMDFRVTVVDDRADFANSARLGAARCIVGEIEGELARFPIDRHTYVVIVTRGHRHDGRALMAVVNSPACYVGLIGSKRKVHTIFEELHQQGISSELLAKVHAPIGLEIGAATPAEIAVSIAAELIAVRRGRGGQAAMPMRVPAEKIAKWFGP